MFDIETEIKINVIIHICLIYNALNLITIYFPSISTVIHKSRQSQIAYSSIC